MNYWREFSTVVFCKVPVNRNESGVSTTYVRDLRETLRVLCPYLVPSINSVLAEEEFVLCLRLRGRFELNEL